MLTCIPQIHSTTSCLDISHKILVRWKYKYFSSQNLNLATYERITICYDWSCTFTLQISCLDLSHKIRGWWKPKYFSSQNLNLTTYERIKMCYDWSCTFVGISCKCLPILNVLIMVWLYVVMFPIVAPFILSAWWLLTLHFANYSRPRRQGLPMFRCTSSNTHFVSQSQPFQFAP